MPWSDNSDQGGRPGQKPGPKHGPWGAPPPPANRDDPPDPERSRGDGPRRPVPPPPEDLLILWRRLRRWLEAELIALRPAMNRRMAAAFAMGLVVLWGLSGFYAVQADQEGVVTTFGAFSRTAGPGLHYHLPMPIEQVQRVPVTAISQISVGARSGDLPKESLMLTGDQNIVSVGVAVQWRITDARKFLFTVTAPEETIAAVADSAMREAVGRATLADVLAGGQSRVAADAAAQTQKTLDRYGLGVNVVSVQIASANPPDEVELDAQAAQNASQDAQSAINQANIYSAQTLAAARAMAAQKAQAAETYRTQAVAEAQGQADAFNAVYAQYQQAPDLTRQQLYLQTMQRVLSKATKIIVDARGGAAPLMLPPDVFRPRTPAGTDSGAPAQQPQPSQ